MTLVHDCTARRTRGLPTPENRRDRESYFLAAYSLLETGHTGLTVDALCDRLGVTKGSFYHHFQDMGSFTAAFMRRWHAWIVGVLDAYRAEPDCGRRLELMVNSHRAVMNGPEPAIRAWARANPEVAAVVRDADDRAATLTADTWRALLSDGGSWATRARLAVALALGLQQKMGPVEQERFVGMAAVLAQRFLGLPVEVVWADYGCALRVDRRPATSDNSWSGRAMHQHASFVGDGLAGRCEATFPSSRPRERAGPHGKEDFFAAARDLLALGGCDDVTIRSLCARLSVTKGSFHHHFGGIEGFVRSMAESWELQRHDWLSDCRSIVDPVRRLEELHRPLVAEPDPAEAAWHAWGWTNPVVAESVGRYERHWAELLEHTLLELGFDGDSASLLAEMGVAITVGVQAHQPPIDRPAAIDIAEEWLRTGLGLDAGIAESNQPRLVVHGRLQSVVK